VEKALQVLASPVEKMWLTTLQRASEANKGITMMSITLQCIGGSNTTDYSVHNISTLGDDQSNAREICR